MKAFSLSLVLMVLVSSFSWAGNPERIGQAGATQLLINPFARSSGIGAINTARIGGVEALMNNPAGLANGRGTELVFAHTRYLVGADIGINAVGLNQQIGNAEYGTNNNFLSASIIAYDFGEIQRTTIDQPDGGLGTYSPTFINLNVGYAHRFLDGRINVGFAVKLVSEAIENVSTSGIAFDAGVQYASENRKFRLGAALRNIGTELNYQGDGLSFRAPLNPNSNFDNSVYTQAEDYQLPSVFLIGLSYDITSGPETNGVFEHRLTPMFNFTSNTFAEDQYGLGLEYAFREILIARAAYQFENGIFSEENSRNVQSGFSGGITFQYPLGRREGAPVLGVDYSFRTTYVFGGIHSVGLHLGL